MATHSNIDLPDAATLPDGTAVTAGNLGLSFLTGTATIETYTGHRTLPDGTRYIRILKGNTLQFRVDEIADHDTGNHYGLEFGISYHLMDGASVPTDEIDNICSDVQADPVSILTQLRATHRARSAISAIDFYTDVFNSTGAGKESVDSSGMRHMRFGETYRMGLGMFHDASGYFFGCLDGHVNTINARCNTAFLATMADWAKVQPLSHADIECHITGPFKTWNTSDMVDELPVPDRSDSLLGSKRFLMRQIHDDLGPFASSGAGTVSWPAFSTGGISVNRHRAVTAGGLVTLDLNSAHEIDSLPTRAGYAAIRVLDIYNPGTNQFRAILGDDSVSDIIDFTIDGDDGFKVKLGGTETGLVANANDRFEFVMLMGPAGSPEALILNNITNNTQGDTRLQVVAWDRGVETGIPSLKSMQATCFDAGTEFGGIWATPGFDMLFSSSFLHTQETDPNPDIGSQNHLSNYMDGFSGRYFRTDLGCFGANPFGRSGHPLTAMDEAANQYADFGLMGAGLHVWCWEWVVNDDADYDDIVAEMALLIDACYDGGNWLTIIESQYQPDKASGPTIDAAWRARQDLINAEVRRLLLAKNAGRRFRWIAINGGRSAAEIETAYFAGGDGLHPAGTGLTYDDASGAELFVQDVFAATPETSSDRGRSRDRLLDRSFR